MKIPREQELKRDERWKKRRCWMTCRCVVFDVRGGGAEELDSQVGKSRRSARAEGRSPTSLEIPDTKIF
jgi:hypothetical protein